VNVARWPAEGCDAGELPLPAESSLFEITPSEVLQRFALDAPLRWSDGSETLLRLAPSAAGATCLADSRSEWIERYDYSLQEDDPALFGQPIELAISTADGRFQATIQTHLQYEADKDGGVRQAWLFHYASLPAGDAGGWSGVEPQDLATPRSWELQVSHEPAAPDADSGALTLRIRRETPPCEGMACLPPGTYVTLLRGELP
jgi:hypothetical protein